MSLNSLVVMTLLVSAAAETPVKLSPTQINAARHVTQTYFEGDSIGVARMVAPIAARASEKSLSAFDQELAKHGVPSTIHLLVDARMKLVEMKMTKLLHQPLIRERIETLEELRNRVDTILEAAKSDPILAGKIGELKSLKEFENVLWKTHVLRNRLKSTEKYISYAKELASGITLDQRLRLNDAERQLVKQSRYLKTNLRQLQPTLDEAAMVVQLDRLRLGVTILQDPEPTKKHFQAAYTTWTDGQAWQAFQRDIRRGDRPKPKHPGFAQHNLVKEVKQQIELSQRLAGKMVERSRELHDGLHWWYKGRYGSGPEFAGLAKSPAAMNDAKLMMALNLPIESPTPTIPDGKKDVPQYDRRHHFTWAWENRFHVQYRQSSARETLKLDNFY